VAGGTDHVSYLARVVAPKVAQPRLPFIIEDLPHRPNRQVDPG